MSPCVVLASPLRDLQETFCARYALDHALPPPHSSDTHQRACLHALHAHKMPQRCARSPCLSATMRRGAPGRPSRARFRPASAAQAPHGAGHILLQAAGTADCSSARPPDLHECGTRKINYLILPTCAHPVAKYRHSVTQAAYILVVCGLEEDVGGPSCNIMSASCLSETH